MAIIKLQVRSIVELGLWDKVLEYKGWNPHILNEGQISEDEWIEFDDEFKKIEYEAEDKYFVSEDAFNDKCYLYERDGDFYNHDDQDVLIATFLKKGYAELVCDLLNGNIANE